MTTLEELYNKNIELLKSLDINYREFSHEPVLSYETAAKMKEKLNWEGVESKNLFLKTKKGEYCMLITVQGKKADLKLLSELLGSKVSLATQEELTEQTGCEPYCAVPFGYPSNIIIIIDKHIFDYDKFLCSPGPSTKTIEIGIVDLKKILESLANRTICI